MKKIHTLSIFAVLVFAISFSVHEVYAISPSVTVLPNPMPFGTTTITVMGTGFPPLTPVYIFLDGSEIDSITTDGSGSFNISFPIPPLSPGKHSIDVSDNPNTLNPIAPTTQFDVSQPTSVPEFPVSLVIIFVAIAAVYMGIRQKMTTNFKRW